MTNRLSQSLFCPPKWGLSLFFVLTTFSSITWAQQMGTISYKQNPLLVSLSQNNVDYNESNNSAPGYRIQVYFGSTREDMNTAKTQFLQYFSNIPTYASFSSPNFRLRVGDYRNRFEAYKALREITVYFPKAKLFADKIAFRSIVAQ